MRRVLCVVVLAVGLGLAAGCGETRPSNKTQISLDEVPAAAMATAKAKLPADVTLTGAYRRTNGDYEIRGKTKDGKVREVEVKADGTFVDME